MFVVTIVWWPRPVEIGSLPVFRLSSGGGLRGWCCASLDIDPCDPLEGTRLCSVVGIHAPHICLRREDFAGLGRASIILVRNELAPGCLVTKLTTRPTTGDTLDACTLDALRRPGVGHFGGVFLPIQPRWAHTVTWHTSVEPAMAHLRLATRGGRTKVEGVRVVCKPTADYSSLPAYALTVAIHQFECGCQPQGAVIQNWGGPGFGTYNPN